MFYRELSPYGSWINYPGEGYVWVPNVDRDFRPYASNGHWVYTDEGWTWDSNYPWGWAAFHYGRWMFEDEYGWIWVPGNEWAPAWVTWGQSDGYYGWAPLAPHISINGSFGRDSWNPPPQYWNFVPFEHMTHENLNRYVINQRNNITIVNNISRNVVIINNNRSNYYMGPRVNEVENHTRQHIQAFRVSDAGRPGNSGITNNQFNIYRPRVNDATNGTGNRPAPAKVEAYRRPIANGQPQGERGNQEQHQGRADNNQQQGNNGNPRPQFPNNNGQQPTNGSGTTFPSGNNNQQQGNNGNPRPQFPNNNAQPGANGSGTTSPAGNNNQQQTNNGNQQQGNNGNPRPQFPNNNAQPGANGSGTTFPSSNNNQQQINNGNQQQGNNGNPRPQFPNNNAQPGANGTQAMPVHNNNQQPQGNGGFQRPSFPNNNPQPAANGTQTNPAATNGSQQQGNPGFQRQQQYRRPDGNGQNLNAPGHQQAATSTVPQPVNFNKPATQPAPAQQRTFPIKQGPVAPVPVRQIQKPVDQRPKPTPAKDDKKNQ
jgi:hypothetical protein